MANNSLTREAAFEAFVDDYLLNYGYASASCDVLDREHVSFPDRVLAFIRETQPMEWAKVEALYGEETASRFSPTYVS